MKTIEEINEKWYGRLINVVYIFLLIIAVICSIYSPIELVFDNYYYFLNPYSYEIDYLRAIPLTIIFIGINLIISFCSLYLLRWAVYYVILGKFNPKK